MIIKKWNEIIVIIQSHNKKTIDVAKLYSGGLISKHAGVLTILLYVYKTPGGV